MVGPLNSADLSFISDEHADHYVRQLQHSSQNKNSKLQKLFPETDPELLKILYGLLEFNPYFRLTSKEALKSKIFDEFRDDLEQ